ncbi:MAG: SMP-30/gluconolactonase/LRE family protein [Alphaproteobacteria bacterium]|nr:SMP-30/gluconolactonase/LRE family protein [Alphaproteobacteria bacterium]
MPSVAPRVALKSSALLGETPVWSEGEQRLYWIDSTAATIHRFDPATGRDETLPVTLTGYLGAMALISGGGLLALCGKRLLRVSGSAAEPIADVEANLPDNLPNDGKVDPQGRFWFGTMHGSVSQPTGNLYSYDRSHGLHRHDGGFACSNGMAWNPDGRTFYFVDMMPGTILAYEFDGQAGSLGKRRIFVSIDPKEGEPDGICCDAAGGVWVAHWDGGCVTRYDPRADSAPRRSRFPCRARPARFLVVAVWRLSTSRRRAMASRARRPSRDRSSPGSRRSPACPWQASRGKPRGIATRRWNGGAGDSRDD